MNSNPTWQEYPRPQLQRDRYMLLNGEWKLNNHAVRVPFPPQSALSDFHGEITDEMTYTCSFVLPKDFTLPRTILHFGAVDQIAGVWLNGVYLGQHEGGYLPFAYDISECINVNGSNQLEVRVTDTLSTLYPYGKQCKKRGGMWYTPVSGIWQSVWLENVPDKYISKLTITPDLTGIDISVKASVQGFTAIVDLDDNDTYTVHFENNSGRLQLLNAASDNGTPIIPQLWNTNTPKLYNMTIISGNDRIRTYFALRTIDIININGINRVCLNGEPIFMHGVLDQGYFSHGIYLPASPSKYEDDILNMKELGINTLRKPCPSAYA